MSDLCADERNNHYCRQSYGLDSAVAAAAFNAVQDVFFPKQLNVAETVAVMKELGYEPEEKL